MFLSCFVVDGAYCVSVVALPSSNVTVRWWRKRYGISGGFLHHHLWRCYNILAQLGFSFNNQMNRWAWLACTSSGFQQKRQCWMAVYHAGGRAAFCMTAWCCGFIRACGFWRTLGTPRETLAFSCGAGKLDLHTLPAACPKQFPQGLSPWGDSWACRDLGLFHAVTWWSFLSRWQSGISVSLCNKCDVMIWCVFLRLFSCRREGVILMLFCYRMPRNGNGLSSRTPLSVQPCWKPCLPWLLSATGASFLLYLTRLHIKHTNFTWYMENRNSTAVWFLGTKAWEVWGSTGFQRWWKRLMCSAWDLTGPASVFLNILQEKIQMNEMVFFQLLRHV